MERIFQVTLNDTDLNKALEDIIQHKNKKEIAKLLSPLLLDNLEACDWLFKLILGNKLPDVIPNNTICLVNINKLNYTVDKSLLLGSKLDNGEGQIVCTIEKFRGFHSNFYNYDITGGPGKLVPKCNFFFAQIGPEIFYSPHKLCRF